MKENEFDHDRLDAYRPAREGSRLLAKVLKLVPRGYGELADQARRASLSVSLNTAEGAGAWLGKEKARFYRTARASATECAAVLDHLVDLDVLSESAVKPTRLIYVRVVATLVKLAASAEKAAHGSHAAHTADRKPPR